VDFDALYIVPTERVVERLALKGTRAETRVTFRTRLLKALRPDIVFAEPSELRLLLAMALEDPETVGPSQLGLFGGVVPPTDKPRGARALEMEPLLASMRARGGASWARMVTELIDAMGLFFARGGTPAHLERVARGHGFVAARARTLALAIRLLAERLASVKRHDPRRVGTILAEAIMNSEFATIEGVLGGKFVRSHAVLSWEPSELLWWRALDDKLALRRGSAKIAMPTFDQPLAGDRERDAFEILADDVARGLDVPAESETIDPALGEVEGLCPEPRIRIVGVRHREATARTASIVVRRALAEGKAIDRIVVAGRRGVPQDVS
jgi:hypothetical protein